MYKEEKKEGTIHPCQNIKGEYLGNKQICTESNGDDTEERKTHGRLEKLIKIFNVSGNPVSIFSSVCILPACFGESCKFFLLVTES